LSLSEEFIEENIRIFENPEAVENSLYYFLLILLFTALILFIIKTKKLRALQYFILFLIFYSFLVTLTSLIPFLPSFIISSFLVILLRFYPEWWVIDLSGVLLSGIAIALLGISLGILPTVILLLILSIYDFISVYKTGHMVSMAKSILELRLPILFVIPTSKNYSFLRGERKGAVFLGLGDVVIPSILAISSNYYFNAPKILSLNIVALFTIIGILIGFFALFFLTSREKAHPGLPFLNGGALVGFLFGLLLT
jgi:presenilin-like A22 family membrane protease